MTDARLCEGTKEKYFQDEYFIFSHRIPPMTRIDNGVDVADELRRPVRASGAYIFSPESQI
jgi:hypothetical protein